MIIHCFHSFPASPIQTMPQSSLTQIVTIPSSVNALSAKCCSDCVEWLQWSDDSLSLTNMGSLRKWQLGNIFAAVASISVPLINWLMTFWLCSGTQSCKLVSCSCVRRDRIINGRVNHLGKMHYFFFSRSTTKGNDAIKIRTRSFYLVPLSLSGGIITSWCWRLL